MKRFALPRLDPPFSRLEKLVFVLAAIPAGIAGYLYGLDLFAWVLR
jgi:hypothetical protein